MRREEHKGDHDREVEHGKHEVRGEDAGDRPDREKRDKHPKKVVRES
jgi:hypothetical protein